jgi:hypothetical protein
MDNPKQTLLKIMKPYAPKNQTIGEEWATAKIIELYFLQKDLLLKERKEKEKYLDYCETNNRLFLRIKESWWRNLLFKLSKINF